MLLDALALRLGEVAGHEIQQLPGRGMVSQAALQGRRQIPDRGRQIPFAVPVSHDLLANRKNRNKAPAPVPGDPAPATAAT